LICRCSHTLSAHYRGISGQCTLCVCPVFWDARDDGSNPVDRPDHYTAGGIECIDALAAALTPAEFRGFCKGNVVKYIWREAHKNGDEDLRKARWYLDRLIRSVDTDTNTNNTNNNDKNEKE